LIPETWLRVVQETFSDGKQTRPSLAKLSPIPFQLIDENPESEETLPTMFPS
jgi:hypothetical protein